MVIQDYIPSPVLRSFVRQYKIIDFNFGGLSQLPVKAYTPRPEQCLQFFITGKNDISYPGAALPLTTGACLIAGQPTSIHYRKVSNRFLSVQVIFQPGAIRRWLGIPAGELTNAIIDASAVTGSPLNILNEQLQEAADHAGIIALIEGFLQKEQAGLRRYDHRINTIAALMCVTEDRPLDWFVREACLSHRQFDRLFYESTGVGPKEYQQIIRFDRAFRMKNRFPEKDWLSIAVQCGYHDYNHLSKAYKQFTGHTPPVFFEIDNQAPERLLGEAEI